MAEPSYDAKVARGIEHLIDLEKAVEAFCDTHPYAVSKRIEGKKKRPTWRIEFTADPADTLIPLIAGDAINNLRFALDHLMAALVAPSRRTHVMFPIFFKGVWDAIVPGEDKERSQQRERWASVTKGLPDGAIAILQHLQPPHRTGDDKQADLLKLINAWSNRDRHQRLPILVQGLTDLDLTVTRSDGKAETATITPDPGTESFDNKTNLPIPKYAVDVEIKGTPLVAIAGRQQRGYFKIPHQLAKVARLIERGIIPALTPFVRDDAT